MTTDFKIYDDPFNFPPAPRAEQQIDDNFSLSIPSEWGFFGDVLKGADAVFDTIQEGADTLFGIRDRKTQSDVNKYIEDSARVAIDERQASFTSRLSNQNLLLIGGIGIASIAGIYLLTKG